MGERTTTHGNSGDAVLCYVYNGGRAGGDRTYGGVDSWDVRDDACACNAGACGQLFELVTYRSRNLAIPKRQLPESKPLHQILHS